MQISYKDKKKFQNRQNKYNSFEFDKKLESYRLNNNEKKRRYLIVSYLKLALFFFILLEICLVFTASYKLAYSSNPNKNPTITNDVIIEDINDSEFDTLDLFEDVTTIDILSLGDFMCYSSQYTDAFENGTYNFDYVFDDTSLCFKNKDYIVGSLETCCLNDSTPLSNYPKSNSPKEFLESIKKQNVNLLTTSTEHSYNYGEQGYLNTLNTLSSLGFDTLSNNSNYIIKHFNNLSIGFVNYSTLENTPNFFDEQKFLADISFLNTSCDLVICLMHWDSSNISSRKQLSNLLISNGVDIILGNHSSKIENFELLKTDNGKQGLIVYSHGNILSDTKANNSQTSIGVNLTITKNLKDKSIEIYTSYYPFFCLKDSNSDKHFKLIDLNFPTEDSNWSTSQINLFNSQRLYLENIIENVSYKKEYN